MILDVDWECVRRPNPPPRYRYCSWDIRVASWQESNFGWDRKIKMRRGRMLLLLLLLDFL